MFFRAFLVFINLQNSQKQSFSQLSEIYFQKITLSNGFLFKIVKGAPGHTITLKIPSGRLHCSYALS